MKRVDDNRHPRPLCEGGFRGLLAFQLGGYTHYESTA